MESCPLVGLPPVDELAGKYPEYSHVPCLDLPRQAAPFRASPCRARPRRAPRYSDAHQHWWLDFLDPEKNGGERNVVITPGKLRQQNATWATTPHPLSFNYPDDHEVTICVWFGPVESFFGWYLHCRSRCAARRKPSLALPSPAVPRRASPCRARQRGTRLARKAYHRNGKLTSSRE